MPLRTVTTEERRARLGLRHRLAELGDSVESITDDLVALHATDPASIFLSASARTPGLTVGDVEAALFDRRTMARTLAMRRTLFVVTVDVIAEVERSSSGTVAAAERRRLEQFLSESGIASPSDWLAGVFDEVLDALTGVDGLAARSLTAAVPTLGTRITMGAGTNHAVEAGATSRVLGLMAVEGHIVRGRPSKDWTGRQYTWHRRDEWWPEPPPDPELSEADAATALLRRWLGRFGPATMADMKWWTGWTMTKTRAALARIETVDVALDGEQSEQTGYLLAADGDPVDAVRPWAKLLPSLDPTAMGWKEREWYLGPHRADLFDRNGNVGPTIWVDGRIVGGWSQSADGAVVIELLEDVGADHRAMIEADRRRVADFVGETVVKPSFPTPLQKRLSAS